jgi:hypothetical protein
MKKDKNDFGKFVIKLGQTERNALMLMCAKWNISPSQLITIIIDEHFRKKLNDREKESLDDDMNCNQVIGEIINANRGVWGYEPGINDIPADKKHMLIPIGYDDVILE